MSRYTKETMKVLVIPDVHLKPWIFERAADALKKAAADCAVCLMDIPDDWNQEFNLDLYLETFDAAINFAKAYPDTLWCWGNHDLSYVWGMMETGFSWFAQSAAASKLVKLQMALPNIDQLAYVHRIDNVLFCHGGLTGAFVRKYAKPDEYNDLDAVVHTINRLDCEDMWNDDSPIWFRPQYHRDTKMYKQQEVLQVVGHTPVKIIERIGNMISCDVFSTYRDGTPIGSQVLPVIDTQRQEICGLESDR